MQKSETRVGPEFVTTRRPPPSAITTRAGPEFVKKNLPAGASSGDHTQAINARQAGEAHEKLAAKRYCLGIRVLLADNPYADLRSDAPVRHQRDLLISQHACYQGHSG
jgi:hypothetical protein